ncbi:AMP-binding protein [Aquimarina sp. 2201CG5-10]|uniref:AMP-binding protein n=1 Tax=Aquimarina callyspongiae TaxID=3098150 RepID=UPI002AB52253|nr:AMP-binding protein [Aquimarina sp. 2201CG5-10]MDY8136282.1 AMP-binding protein [Aquimarina sp. 2201CG5-10]
MNIINQIAKSFDQHQNRDAFCINTVKYTYGDLKNAISGIRLLIQKEISKDQKNVGLIANDDIQTYASIFALWLEGKSYVPINPDAPYERNSFVLKETNSFAILDSAKSSLYTTDFKVVDTLESPETEINLEPSNFSEDNLAYILFTSGSTGLPKGVPITFKNLGTLMGAMEADENHKIYPDDRCLHMFELTFDFSLVTFLTPLLYGACVYTIPKNQIKYFYIYKLIVEAELTYLIMVPSVIHYLRPYFEEINATSVRYCCFGAAPLHIDIANEWRNCVPNAQVYNSYGPTEFTVTTTYYSFAENDTPRTRNGVVSLGKVLQGVEAVIIDQEENVLGVDEEGELCLAGEQLTSGYWNNEKKNKTSFFYLEINGKQTRFYKTGDLCVKDENDYLIFIGRKDFQVKIRGYRVELSEIEFYAKEKLDKINVQAIDIVNNLGNTEIGLVLESEEFDTNTMITHMKNKLPDYMIPTHIRFINEFPLNGNGKIDRKQLKTYFDLNS